MRRVRTVTLRRVLALAEEQHGVVSRDQLRSLGLNGPAIDYRVRRGRLHRVARGVYAVGRPQLPQHGRWMTAVLTCGGGAVLSHSSAAALWRMGREVPQLSELSLPSASYRQRDALLIHRRPALRRRDVTEEYGIPVTTPVQTLVDMALRLDRAEIERMINGADKYNVIHPPALRRALAERAGERGVAKLRHILDRRTFRLTREELERRFLPLVPKAGLPLPLTFQIVNGFEVDFHWPDLRFVVETDGLRYHRTPAEQARDRLRDQTHTAAGFTHLRFTHEQVRYEPDRVLSVLRATAPLAAARAGSYASSRPAICTK